MKKSYFVLLFSILSIGLSAQAPSYVDFEWDVLHLGYAFASGDNAKAGGFGLTEVRYNATDQFSIGLGFGGQDIYEDIGDTDIASGQSYLVGEYYLRGDSGQRPFVGFSTGLSFRTVDLGENSEETSTSSMFSPRVGYEFNHIRILAQYNVIPKESHNNFFSLSVGLTLWGGYKGAQFE